MKDMNMNTVIKETVLAIILALVFMMTSLQLFGTLLMLLPIIFIVLGIRNDVYSSIVGLSIMTIILWITIGASFALSIFIIFTPMTFVMQYLISREKKPNQIVLISGIVLMLSFILVLFLEANLTGIGLEEQVGEAFQELMAVQLEGLEEVAKSKRELVEGRQLLKAGFDFLMTVMPMILLSASLVTSYLNYRISTLLARWMGLDLETLEFSTFKLPDNIMLGSLVMFLANGVLSMLEVNYHVALTLNLSFLIAFIFLVQGLALVDYLLKRLGVNKFFRVLILVINIAMVPVGMVLAILGIADSIFDFRKIRRKQA